MNMNWFNLRNNGIINKNNKNNKKKMIINEKL